MLLYLILGIGLLAGGWAFIASHDHTVAAAQQAKDQVAMDVVKKDRDTAVAANVSLGAQFGTFRAIHNQQVEALHADYAATQANKTAVASSVKPRLDQIALDKFNLIVALGKADDGITCDQLDTMLLDVAKQRQRDYGPASQPADASAVRISSPAPATGRERTPADVTVPPKPKPVAK